MTARGGTDSPWDADPVAPADAERMRSAAAELERFARATDVAPRAGLAGSIMSMVAVEPTPAPLTALSAATRRRRFGAMLAALRDAWRVTWSGGRPIAIRVSAAMAVLVLVITTGSVGGLAAMGAWTAVQPAPTTPAPSPSVDQVPVVVPPMQPSASPAAPAGTAAPTPSGSPAPTSSPGPAPSAAPTHTTRPTMKPTPRPTPRPTARPTVKPTHHPDPTSMPMPTHHPEPSHGTGHG